ncbi:hypothetical protein M427DRAFT_28363 [Gonapodya prolifera JEL478]|uniref:DUF952-domain-containing protein n=1 Tax=Gonapodya prolifera (strain JEL478) TaxID=1344416 RepID=A0A139ATI5_GONPJ|nr:hypothetical protein M427DRAFT_28363 [Gonapodya prolifera JEL478]|eukprot:KXS20004.1 hypothetical protein M427DRAFT_28363 [Gonapodya prolifera JEL478]
MATPTFLYKILTVAEHAALGDPNSVFKGTWLDQRDGFVHLSTANQVANTLRLFFPLEKHQKVFILQLKFADSPQLASLVKFEAPAGPDHQGGPLPPGDFPHVYQTATEGLILGRDLAATIEVAHTSSGDGWDLPQLQL